MGISALIAPIIEAATSAETVASIGAGITGALGTTAAGALDAAALGAVGGGALSGIEGKPILPGALGGAITGGALGGLGGFVSNELGGGLAGGLGEVGLGAGAGALGSALTGQNIGQGALGGALSGGVAALGAGGGGASASSTAAPAQAGTSALSSAPGDLTQSIGLSPGLEPETNIFNQPYGPGSDLSFATGDGGGVPAQQAPVGSPVADTSKFAMGPGDAASAQASAISTADALGLAQQGAAASAGDVGAGTKLSLSNLMNDPLGTLSSNPGVALGALGLGYQALKGNEMPKGYNQLAGEAAALTSEANQLSSQALNQALPPGAQAQLDQASNAMKARVQSQFSRMGLGGSTMEAQALASVDQQVASQGYSIMQNLMQQGLSAAQAADAMLNQIMSAQVSQQNALTGAIGQFAGGLAGASLKA